MKRCRFWQGALSVARAGLLQRYRVVGARKSALGNWERCNALPKVRCTWVREAWGAVGIRVLLYNNSLTVVENYAMMRVLAPLYLS
jgi:hypothetical protein